MKFYDEIKERLIDKIEEKRQLRSFIYYLNKELEERNKYSNGRIVWVKRLMKKNFVVKYLLVKN